MVFFEIMIEKAEDIEPVFWPNYIDRVKENGKFLKIDLTVEGKVQMANMSLRPGERVIKRNVPSSLQLIDVISGTGTVNVESAESTVNPGSFVLIPHGSTHDIIPSDSESLVMRVIFIPPAEYPFEVDQTQSDYIFQDFILRIVERFSKRQLKSSSTNYKYDYEGGWINIKMPLMTYVSESGGVDNEKKFQRISERKLNNLKRILIDKYEMTIEKISLYDNTVHIKKAR